MRHFPLQGLLNQKAIYRPLFTQTESSEGRLCDDHKERPEVGVSGVWSRKGLQNQPDQKPITIVFRIEGKGHNPMPVPLQFCPMWQTCPLT